MGYTLRLHLHIYISQSLPPTALHRSCQLICWPSSEAALMAGQRMAANKKKTNYYRTVVCVCFSPSLTSPLIRRRSWTGFFSPNIMRCSRVKSAHQGRHMFYCQEVLNLRVLTKCRLKSAPRSSRVPWVQSPGGSPTQPLPLEQPDRIHLRQLPVGAARSSDGLACAREPLKDLGLCLE